MKERVRKLLKPLDSLRIRVLVMLLSVNILIIGIFAFATIYVFQSALVQEIGTTRSDVLSQIGERVRVAKSNAYTLSNLYYYDTNLQTLIGAIPEGGDPELAAQYFLYLSQKYKASFDQFGVDYTAVVAFENGGGLCSEPVPEDYDYMSPQNKIWYKRVYQERGELVDIASYKDKQLGSISFSVARSINNDEGQPLAYLMVNIDERKIYDMYKGVVSDTSNIYVVDTEGTIISSSIERLRGFNLFSMTNLDKLFGDKEYTISTIDSRDALFTRYYDAETGVTVLEEIPLDALTGPMRRVRAMVVVVALAAVALAGLWAWRFSNKTIAPIQQLSDFVTTIHGDSIVQQCTVSGYSEVNTLREGLNSMLYRIGTLVESVKQKESQKRRMELGFLQAQINPHFMYNTLFSVKCMVDMEKNSEASQMLTSFIALLRGSLSNPDEFVTVQTEFEQLRQYAEIQRFRYTDQLDILLEYEQETADKRIPKLLIQPLVENAIFHGVEGSGGRGCVAVLARIAGNSLLITVEDDGAGMTPEQVATLRHGKADSSSAHIGVNNVRERIQLYFGDECDLDIDSTVGQGTRIRLLLPVIE